jgi:hypothetical protein
VDERRAQGSILLPAELDQEPPSWPQEAGSGKNDLANKIQAIVTTVEGEPGLVPLHVAW